MPGNPAAHFFAELKRRKVFRVAIAYAVVAWLIAQVADLAATNFEAPAWVVKMIITLLLLGLPVALLMAWAYEMTPDGLQRESDRVENGTTSARKASGLNGVIAAGLVLALAYLAYDKFIDRPETDAASAESAADQAQVATAPSGNSQATVHSIAVLPFLNMSDDPDNEYFADGLSEELLNLLVRNPQLRVAARTSSFSFKGKDVKISDIARELNVGHVLEGSVRKSGDQLRITAQLVKAEDGFHLWSETFDRRLDQIFVIQDEIASKVAAALEVTLLGGTRQQREIDADSYAAYLRGLHFLRRRGADNVSRSIEYFQEAVELDPNHAMAWGLLAFAISERITFGLLPREEGIPVVQDALERAGRLDPGNASLQASEGYIRKNLFWDWTGAEAAIAQAHQRDPRDPNISTWRASVLMSLGRIDDAIPIYEDAIATDPLSLSLHSALGLAYTKAHRYDEAIGIFSDQLNINPNYHWGQSNLGKAWLFKGDATRALEEISSNPDNIFKAASLPVVYHSLGRDTDADTAMQALLEEYGSDGTAVFVASAFSWRGHHDQAFEWLERGLKARAGSIAYILGENLFYPLRDDPRWPAFLERAGLLEYWRQMPAKYGGPP